MRSVIQTGARFLLDPRQQHEPTLMTADAAERSRRVRFLERAIDIAAELESDCVSFWSGVLREPEVSSEAAFDRLCSGLRQVMDYAQRRHVVLGFEPEPGMFIDTMAQHEELLKRIDAPCFRLTLDVGHLHCMGETPIADFIRRWAPRLVNVHIEDMRRGVHEHLMFGDGEIDLSDGDARFKRGQLCRWSPRRIEPSRPHGAGSCPTGLRVLAAAGKVTSGVRRA